MREALLDIVALLLDNARSTKVFLPRLRKFAPLCVNFQESHSIDLAAISQVVPPVRVEKRH
jgi:hypothetical protein